MQLSPPFQQPSTSWDHLTHLTISPHWSIMRAKVGLYLPALTKRPLHRRLHTSWTESPFRAPTATLEYLGLQRCNALYCMHASVPRLTPTHAFRCNSQTTQIHDSTNENISSSEPNEHWRWCCRRLMQMSWCSSADTLAGFSLYVRITYILYIYIYILHLHSVADYAFVVFR